jgi:hypothetical protein
MGGQWVVSYACFAWPFLQTHESLYCFGKFITGHQDWLTMKPTSLLKVSGVKPDLDGLLYNVIHVSWPQHQFWLHLCSKQCNRIHGLQENGSHWDQASLQKL